jgi:hypothetical protein
MPFFFLLEDSCLGSALSAALGCAPWAWEDAGAPVVGALLAGGGAVEVDSAAPVLDEPVADPGAVGGGGPELSGAGLESGVGARTGTALEGARAVPFVAGVAAGVSEAVLGSSGEVMICSPMLVPEVAGAPTG